MAFTAKQKMYNFSKPKKRKAKKVRTVKAVEVRSPKRRPIEKRVPVAREVIVIEQTKKGTKMATKTKRRKSRKGTAKRTAKRSAPRRRRATKVASAPRRRRRSVKQYVGHHVRRAGRALKSAGGGIITSNKKESIINLSCIGAGFIGSMAIMNLAPIPATIKNLKWKGAALSGITILLALKVKDKKARLALAGAAVYGIVDVLKNYIPQLASLSGYDSQRALILSGAVQSRARAAIGSGRGRTMAVGYTHTQAAPAKPMNRAMVTGASNYRGSETSFSSGY